MKTTCFFLIFLFLGLTTANNASIQPVPRQNFRFLEESISLLTLNCWGLPIWYPGSNKKQRFCDITKSLATSNIDIVCLQETFHQRLRKKIYKELSIKYYISGDASCSRTELGVLNMDCYGGLMTLSKYPMIAQAFYPFEINENTPIIEKIGAKGFLVTTIDLGDEVINVLNTHMCSGIEDYYAKIRMKQLIYMDSIIRHDPMFRDKALYLAGDFNMAHPDLCNAHGLKADCSEYDYLTFDIGVADPMRDLDESSYSFDHVTNHYAPTDSPRQKLDYIVSLKNGCEGKIKNCKVVYNKDQSISDHSGLLAVIKLKSNGRNLIAYNNQL